MLMLGDIIRITVASHKLYLGSIFICDSNFLNPVIRMISSRGTFTRVASKQNSTHFVFQVLPGHKLAKKGAGGG